MRQNNNFALRLKFTHRRFQTERQFLRFVTAFEEDIMTKRQLLYAKFEAVEEQLAHCYFLLHERFISNPPLAKFWAETAIDELQHQSTLRFCRERGLMADIDVDMKITGRIEDLLDTVKGIVSDHDVSVDEAFYAALLMESSELEDIYEKLTRSLAKDHPLLLDAIEANLRSHHLAFADAVEKFSGDRGLAEAFRNLGKYLS
jgi:hypothetical protein